MWLCRRLPWMENASLKHDNKAYRFGRSYWKSLMTRVVDGNRGCNDKWKLVEKTNVLNSINGLQDTHSLNQTNESFVMGSLQSGPEGRVILGKYMTENQEDKKTTQFCLHTCRKKPSATQFFGIMLMPAWSLKKRTEIHSKVHQCHKGGMIMGNGRVWISTLPALTDAKNHRFIQWHSRYPSYENVKNNESQRSWKINQGIQKALLQSHKAPSGWASGTNRRKGIIEQNKSLRTGRNNTPGLWYLSTLQTVWLKRLQTDSIRPFLQMRC